MYKTYYMSELGKIVLVSNGQKLIGLWFENQKYYFGKIKQHTVTLNDDLKIFKEAKNWLTRYFSGYAPSIKELDICPMGSEFQQEVFEMLCQIPYGKVTTYGSIAAAIAKKRGKKTMSAQAVGNAVGHNPLSIIIPCHRVIGTNGSITGYASGIDKKMKLLALEQVDISKLTIFKN